jgi:hypothetical protein
METEIFDDVFTARTRGRRAWQTRQSLAANPFESSTHPDLFAAWAQGWLGEDHIAELEETE